MTGNPKDAREALRRLADALTDEILNAPDKQVLEDAAEIYGDTDKLVADMLRRFEQTASEQGKARLAAATSFVMCMQTGDGTAANRAQEYRRIAQQCLEMAQTIMNPEGRVALVQMAEIWLRLAEEQEASAPQRQQQIQPKNDNNKE